MMEGGKGGSASRSKVGLGLRRELGVRVRLGLGGRFEQSRADGGGE